MTLKDVPKIIATLRNIPDEDQMLEAKSMIATTDPDSRDTIRKYILNHFDQDQAQVLLGNLPEDEGFPYLSDNIDPDSDTHVT